MMAAAWKRVKWTLASQVFDRAELKADALPPGLGEAAPSAAFETLMAGARLADAATFLGQALPRFETAAWACLATLKLTKAPTAKEKRALDAVRTWVAEPAEMARRACFEAAEALGSDSPARYAALAVFFSGGSIAPEEAPDVEPPPELAGRFAAGAVNLAASRAAAPDAAHREALAIGAEIAAGQISKLLAAA